MSSSLGGTRYFGKRFAEKESSTQLNFSVTSVRFPIVLGRDDHSGSPAWHISRIKIGLPIYFPNMNSRIGFISSLEASEFLFWLHDKKMEGSFNAGSPDSLLLRELVEIIEAATARKYIAATSATTENHSPFGVESDWTMNTSESGYPFSPLKSSLPSLIRIESD